jgi:hypothetical protein
VAEAKLIAMRLGKPPAGYGRWSLQLLADELVVLEVVPSICAETVRKTLKKTTVRQTAKMQAILDTCVPVRRAEQGGFSWTALSS